MQIRTLNLWILRFAQYDRQKNFCGVLGGLWWFWGFLGWNFVEFECGGIFWNAAWVFWGFGGSFAGIFGACGINSAKFAQTLAI